MKTWFRNLFILPASVLLLLAATVASQAAVTAPTLTITTPKANELWSNADFTITGTVTKGTAAISNVLISFNSGSWTAATLSGTKWTNVVVLTPGTNVISAYAQDINGVPSKTNTVKFIYLPSALLTLSIVGPGSVSPDDTNALLALGHNYTIKATAAKGFGFNFWNVGGSISTSASLTFTMQSGLDITANFKDITPPTIAITAPKANEEWSNQDFTVTGTAKDNVTISNVNVSVNGGAWATASLSNGGSNWTTGVTLTPGNNTVAAYAVGAGDLSSTTNTVKVVYVPSALLTLNVVGEGSVSPNDNNALLAVGHNYTLKATPTKGFGFFFWNVGATMTNNATLNFTMESNLVITANFQDITPPVLTITSPKSGLHFSNAVIQVSGIATDNVAVVSVQARVNGGSWVPATGTSSWTVSLPVVTGSNIVQATAEDAAGNFSKTNTVSFIGFPPSQTTWAPTSLSSELITLMPETGTLIPHYACFGSSTFSFGDTNDSSLNDSGIGDYDYQFVDTNYAVIQMAYTAPPTNNGVAVVIDLAFTDFDTGDYTNELTGEIGTFNITSASQFAPSSLNGKSVTVQPSDQTKATTLTFTTTGVTLHTTSGSVTGTYSVDVASPQGEFDPLNLTEGAESGTIYAQLTFLTSTTGIYEVDDYLEGIFEKYDRGTFIMK